MDLLSDFVQESQEAQLKIREGEFEEWLFENPEGDYKEFLDEKWSELMVIREDELRSMNV